MIDCGAARLHLSDCSSFHVLLVRRLLIILSLLVLPAPAFAQTGESAPPHADVLADLTSECLEPAITAPSSFRFLAQGATDLVASSLVAAWTREGKTVFIQPPDTPVALLVATTDQAVVDLKRDGRRMLTRTVSVDLTWWLSSPEGDVIGTDTCRSSSRDSLTRSQAESMAVDGSSVLDPSLPPRSRLVHAAQPVVLLAGTAVGTYLLFNLRSRRSDDG